MDLEATIDEPSGIHFDSQRLKTSLRLRYEAEARILTDQMGGLEEVRKTLHLSRRKMCQLMLVDPSSWTRWTRGEGRVPPHILKALQWYLLLVEKYPSLHPQHKIGISESSNRGVSTDQLREISQQKHLLEQKVQDLEAVLQSRMTEITQNIGEKSQVGAAWKMLLLMNTLFMIWMILRLLF